MHLHDRAARLLVVTFAALAITGVGASQARATVAQASSTDMLLTQNQMRFAAGAPTIPADGRLVAAAQAHAQYSVTNGTGGHFETAGLPGYTGYAPRDRALAQGFNAAFVSEVATGASDPISGVQTLWDAPYHRLGMIHPNAYTVGWGFASSGTRYTVVGDIAYDFGMSTVDVVRSPARGQSGVATSWSGRESPSPVPAGTSGPYGYPIMAVWSGGRSVDLRGASITANGSAIPFSVASQEFERDYIVLVPQKPLPSATIAVRMDVTVAGRWLTEEWSFTTAGAVAPTPPPSYHSAWITESAWPTIAVGESTTLSITFKNTGTATWTRGSATQANLGVNGDDREFFQLGMADGWPVPDRPGIQDSAVVPPGATTTFTFRVKGTAPGTYSLHLRAVIDGITWLEDEGVYMTVTVR
jgi:uncharacterized protein YkwD